MQCNVPAHRGGGTQERPWCNQMWIQDTRTRRGKASFSKSKIIKCPDNQTKPNE